MSLPVILRPAAAADHLLWVPSLTAAAQDRSLYVARQYSEIGMTLAAKTCGCWAASLGDCGGGLSGEHIVSDAVLQTMIVVQGFSWCKDRPRTIGAASFTAKHLCERHNSWSSRFDTAAKDFLTTFKTAFEVREQQIDGSWAGPIPRYHHIDGFGLERWLCKTLVNVALVNQRDCEIPVERLARHIWRGEPFIHPYGLSFAVAKTLSGDWADDSITILPLLGHNDARPVLVGGLAIIRSFRFVFLIPGEIEPVVDGKLPLQPSNADWQGLQLNWHNKEIVLKSGPVRGQIVSIGWDDTRVSSLRDSP